MVVTDLAAAAALVVSLALTDHASAEAPAGERTLDDAAVHEVRLHGTPRSARWSLHRSWPPPPPVESRDAELEQSVEAASPRCHGPNCPGKRRRRSRPEPPPIAECPSSECRLELPTGLYRLSVGGPGVARTERDLRVTSDLDLELIAPRAALKWGGLGLAVVGSAAFGAGVLGLMLCRS